MSDHQQHFEEHLEGVWKQRWWALAPAELDLIEVTHYKSGSVSDAIIGVSGVADNGRRFEMDLAPNATRIPGYKRVVAQPSPEDGVS